MSRSHDPHGAGPAEPDSVELVRAAQAGRLPAFERLFELYYTRVKGVVRRRIGPELRRACDSDDVLHETMIEAIRSFDRYEMRDDAALLDWFAGIVENRVRALVRHGRAAKRDRAAEVALDHIRSTISAGTLQLQLEDEGPKPDEAYTEREEIELLGNCLDELEERHRKIILLRVYESASWQSVADTMEIPSPDAARMLYAKARIELSKLVSRRGGGKSDA